jgi:hypothetical protein
MGEALLKGTRALEIAQRLGDLRLHIPAAACLAQVHYCRADYQRVADLVSDSLAAFPLRPDPGRLRNAAPASVLWQGQVGDSTDVPRSGNVDSLVDTAPISYHEPLDTPHPLWRVRFGTRGNRFGRGRSI